MANYKNFASDYPRRCLKLLDDFYELAKIMEHEVTFLLMAAAGGFVVPYERLGWGKSIKQPALDRSFNITTMNTLKCEFEKPIRCNNDFCEILRVWRYADLGKLAGVDDADYIITAARNASLINLEKNVSTPINIFRNSIAHGNVLTIPTPYIRKGAEREEIEKLVFVSGGIIGDLERFTTEFVILTPNDLKNFLYTWFKYLNRIDNKSQHAAMEALDRAVV